MCWKCATLFHVETPNVIYAWVLVYYINSVCFGIMFNSFILWPEKEFVAATMTEGRMTHLTSVEMFQTAMGF